MAPDLILMVGIGGAAGGYARFRLTLRIQSATRTAFPLGTLLVNLSGSFLLGLLIPALLNAGLSDRIHALIAVGVLGAFTTFSTFALEAVLLHREGKRGIAGLYAACSLAGGLLSVAAGSALGAYFV